MKKIKIAIAGVGNCASSLVQGLNFYSSHHEDAPGVAYKDVGGYRLEHIQVVAAFDIDQRKVGKSLEEAIFAQPNCTAVFCKNLKPFGVTVKMSPILDGVAAHMRSYPQENRFIVSQQKPVNIAEELKLSKADILLCYLPVGSEEAVKHYARACLQARIAMVNCVPVFIASNPQIAKEFKDKQVPIVGDDIKSQFGATILHRSLVRLMSDRGIKIDRTYQLNTGGNTDFLNMLEQSRLKSKKVSKTESVQSQLDERLDPQNIHIGPSDYVPWQKDNKICFLRIEACGFGNVPMNIEARLSVEDSPNSAGVVIDAIRAAKLALDRKIGGPLGAVCSLLMKSPPHQMRDTEAKAAFEKFIQEESAPLPASKDRFLGDTAHDHSY
ncbi:MAG: inositol-3-phosphate synthase [Deltaproteobacteria bacterium]|nr:inositol-3-phosphate synthase [Deltaproteobacteria bacterium]